MADCRYVLRLGVRGDRALDLMKELMLSAGIWRQKSTGYVSPGDLRRDADGEVVADLCRPYWLDFSPVSLKPEDFIAIDAAKARVRDSLAERMRQTVRDRLWGSSSAGFLRKSLCLVDALKGATRDSLVEAYGEGVTQAVYGAWVDPLAVAIAESIRRHIVLKAERRDEERRAVNERQSAEIARMDARHRGEIAEAEASLRLLYSGGFA